MEPTERFEQLLRCLLQIIGRNAMPTETVYKILGQGKKQLKAFNLCDGSLTQKEIARKSGVDQGNLSRTVNRWVRNGIAFWIGEGREATLLHIYPLPEGAKRERKKTKPR